MAEMFALRNSALNPFLYATVGIEHNGCGLTMMSVLARLDKDPWAEAAVWSHTSEDTAIEALTRTILLLQLPQPSEESARYTAVRLIALLPRTAPPLDAGAALVNNTRSIAVRDFLWVVIGCVWLYAALAIGTEFAAKSDAPTVTSGAASAASSNIQTIDRGP